MRKALLYILAIFTLMLCTLLSPTGGLAFECVTKEGEDLTFANVEDALSNYYSNGYSEELWKLNVHPWIALQAIEVLKRQYRPKYDEIRENANMIVYGSVEEDYDHNGTATEPEYSHMEHTDKLDRFEDYSRFLDGSGYNSTRCLNHFSPCLIPKSNLTLIAAARVNFAYTDALEWILDSDINLMDLNRAETEQYRSELLRIWGHAIHILGDMGCPPHVRNDDHAVLSIVEPNISVYEPILAKQSFGGLYTYGGGHFLSEEVEIKSCSSVRDYFEQLASWTRTHFLSHGTMFSPTYPIRDAWIGWEWSLTGSAYDIDGHYYKTLYVSAHDKESGESVRLAAATIDFLTRYILNTEVEYQTVKSLRDDALYHFCEQNGKAFQIDDEVVKDFWRYSRGEIVGYAAGLINFLFDEYIGLPAPPSPANLTVVSGDGQVTLSWTPVDGATSYNIYRGTAAGVTTSNGTLIPNVTSPYVDTGLTNGVTYYYAVTAINSSGLESALSGEASAAPVPAAPAPSWSDTVNDPIGDAPSGYDIVKARASHDGFYLSVEIELADSFDYYDATFYNTVIGARISTGGAMYMIALRNEPPFCYEADFCFPNWWHGYMIVSYDGGRNWQSLPSVEMPSFATYEGNVITVRAGISRMEAGPWTIDFVSGVLLNSGPFEVEIKDLTDSLIVPEIARPMPSGDCTDNDNTGPTILKSNFINNGQERTSNPTVTLNLAAQDECGVARYQIIPFIGDDAVITKQMAELDTLRAEFGLSLDPTKWVAVTERLWAHGFVDIAYQTYIRDVPYTFEFPVIENGKILGACIIWQDAKGNISWAYDDIIFSATPTVSWGEI